MARCPRFHTAHDVSGPHLLFAGRYPREGGSGEHERESGGPRALPGPSRSRVRLAAPPVYETAPWTRQMAPAPGALQVRAKITHRTAQIGLWPSTWYLATGTVAFLGRSVAE